MHKRDYGVFEDWDQVARVMDGPGLLLVVGSLDGPRNVMTIGWGLLGVIWGRPVMTVLVRPSRHTYGIIDEAEDFTVNVPAPALERAVAMCGAVSGRDHDKFAEEGLTAVASRLVRAPVIDECVLHYECKIVHKNDLLLATMAPDVAARYPSGKNVHRVFFGEVVATYGVPDLAGHLAAS